VVDLGMVDIRVIDTGVIVIVGVVDEDCLREVEVVDKDYLMKVKVVMDGCLLEDLIRFGAYQRLRFNHQD